MKKITFNTLPEAITELINRVEKIEKILSKRTSNLKPPKTPEKARRGRHQETPAGLLSVKEAAKYLKMSLVNLYSYVKNKKIPYEKKGRRLYFSKTALNSWNKSRSPLNISSDQITIKDAKKLFKVAASTIYYKIRSQKIKPSTKRGNKLYFSKKELINAFTKPTKRVRKVSKSKPAKQGKLTPAPKTAPAKSNAVSKTTKSAKPSKTAKKAAPKSANAPKVAKPVKKAKPAKTQKKRKASKPAKSSKAEVKSSETTPVENVQQNQLQQENQQPNDSSK